MEKGEIVAFLTFEIQIQVQDLNQVFRLFWHTCRLYKQTQTLFGTFDDFGVKDDQKVSHNMILMSKYKGQHGAKKQVKKFGQGPPPPLSGNAPKKSIFLLWGRPLVLDILSQWSVPLPPMCSVSENRGKIWENRQKVQVSGMTDSTVMISGTIGGMKYSANRTATGSP